MSRPGSIHYAKFAKSARLQRMLHLLIDGKKHTTLDIIQSAGICAVNSAAAELRQNGFDVRCDCKRPASYWLSDTVSATILCGQLLDKEVA